MAVQKLLSVELIVNYALAAIPLLFIGVVLYMLLHLLVSHLLLVVFHRVFLLMGSLRIFVVPVVYLLNDFHILFCFLYHGSVAFFRSFSIEAWVDNGVHFYLD